MEFNAKSVIIGRKKRGEKYNRELLTRPIFINLFEENNPHMKPALPIETIEFEKVEKVEIKNLMIEYFTMGNDIVINNLETVRIQEKGFNIYITGKQIQE